jgi:hypothetical protein
MTIGLVYYQEPVQVMSQIYYSSVWGNVVTAVQQEHLYIEYHSVCPLVGIGTLPPPLTPTSVLLPISNAPIPTNGEKLSTLPTLCLCDEGGVGVVLVIY